jgi:hypothetical protein
MCGRPVSGSLWHRGIRALGDPAGERLSVIVRLDVVLRAVAVEVLEAGQ